MNVQPNLQMDKPTFLAWVQGREERYELAGGRVVMMTGGTIWHALIVSNLMEQLKARLDRKRWRVVTELGVDAGPGTIRYPDIAVIEFPGSAKGRDQTIKTPVLVAEVLSPSTMKTDFGDKAAEYLRLPSVAAYLLFAQDEVKAWAHVRGSEQPPLGPQVLEGNEATIAIPALGIELSLADVYADIEFD
jgi:Uma2 family endonuclease